jgi:hypothetical protein
MPLPHTFLTVAAAAGLWWAGHAWSCARPALCATAAVPAFALPGSAYGSLTARVMRDSLYSYWHGGESATPALPSAPAPAKNDAPPPPPPPGRFARLRPQQPPQPQQPPPAPDAEEASLLQQGVNKLARLENGRTKRNNPAAPSDAHRRYLHASAGWRLRLAHEMDPGDAVLYEVLHYHITSQPEAGEGTRKMALGLAEKAITHALAPRASISDALTGAGAAINILNEELQMKRNGRPDDASILHHWSRLTQCLERYRAVRREADAEGWWQGIPAVRQQEIESHGAMLERIAETIRKTLLDMKLIS